MHFNPIFSFLTIQFRIQEKNDETRESPYPSNYNYNEIETNNRARWQREKKGETEGVPKLDPPWWHYCPIGWMRWANPLFTNFISSSLISQSNWLHLLSPESNQSSKSVTKLSGSIARPFPNVAKYRSTCLVSKAVRAVNGSVHSLQKIHVEYIFTAFSNSKISPISVLRLSLCCALSN